MNTHDTVRDLLTTKLKGVEGIGKVFDHVRFSADLQSFLEMFTVPHPYDATKRIPCVTWIERFLVSDFPSWTEDMQVAVVTQTSRWRITLFYGLYDNDETDLASETHFQRLVDNIIAALRFDVTLGDTTGTILRSYPVDVPTLGVFTQELSGYTCHRAEILARVEVLINE